MTERELVTQVKLVVEESWHDFAVSVSLVRSWIRTAHLGRRMGPRPRKDGPGNDSAQV